jgi:hypothetical protein
MGPDLCSKVSIIDLMSPGFFIGQELSKLSNPIMTGRISPHNWLTTPCDLDPLKSIPLYAAFLDEEFCKTNFNSSRWGKARELRDFQVKHPLTWKDMTDEKKVAQERLRLQADLLENLCDSMVDQQVQCRYQ